MQDYAEMLYRSPKTLSNLFAAYGLPSPLRIIHERIEAEAKRLLLYTNKSAKEIGEILGFEDLAAFSRFFRKMAKESISEYRKKRERRNNGKLKRYNCHFTGRKICRPLQCKLNP